MGTPLTRRWLRLWLAGAELAAAAAFATLRPASAASTADCASLGQAANFAAFSNGDFVAGSETITGRIAAARDVALGASGGGAFISGAAGDASPTVIAGRNFSAGQSGAGGTLHGGVRYGGTSSVASNFVSTAPRRMARRRSPLPTSSRP